MYMFVSFLFFPGLLCCQRLFLMFLTLGSLKPGQTWTVNITCSFVCGA